MPDDEQEPAREPDRNVQAVRVFTGYGIASAVLGVVAVVAVILATVIWTQHHAHEEELDYRSRALQAAAEWTGVLINMSPETVDQDLTTLHEGTVGQLNVDFEATMAPFRRLVQTLDSRTSGLVDSVALETIHHDPPGAPPREPQSDLGGLAEEGLQDDSRLKKHAFWTVDPLDGTQFFIEGTPGYSTSIALVSRSGRPLVAAVYDPVNDLLYEAVRGRGVTLNGEAIPRSDTGSMGDGPTIWLADRSLPSYPYYEGVKTQYAIRYVGGAVLNALQLLTVPNSVYAKATKASQSGCAIWDLAAVVLMIEELGGGVRTYNGETLNLNRDHSVFFNDIGFAMACPDINIEVFLRDLERLG